MPPEIHAEPPQGFIKKKIHTIKEFVEKYEAHLSAAAMVIGFIGDNIFINRIDELQTNVIFVTYLLSVAVAIIYINAFEAGRLHGKFFERLALVTPFIMQIFLGGLFSGFVVFYSRSASILTSWPFTLGLLGLLIGNEKFRKPYQKFNFQLAIFYIALFSYCMAIVPVLLSSITAGAFIASGVVSIILMRLFINFLSKVNPRKVARDKKLLYTILITIYIASNALYFLNIIPPAPLSLKDAGIYHFVTKIGPGTYDVLAENVPWYRRLTYWNFVYHWTEGEPVYAYSAVFAPKNFQVTIYHNWAYFDETQKRWVPTNHIPIDISGGNENGFRGYSVKESMKPGDWRVDVSTVRGQVIGRIKFKVTASEAAPELIHKQL